MEQTSQQEDQAASITRSAEAFEKHLATEGVFHYLEPNKGDAEETVTFDDVMSDCSSNPEFINAVFLLYKEIKRPLEEFEGDELGVKLLALTHEIDEIVTSHAAFYSNLEHGVD